MTEENNPSDVRNVLRAFVAECDARPSATQIRTWQERHPTFAADIADMAEAMDRAPGAQPDRRPTPEEEEADARLLAEFADLMSVIEPPATLSDLMTRQGQTVPEMAEAIDIHPVVLAAIVTGQSDAPSGARLPSALARLWHLAERVVVDAIQASAAQPSFGIASAEGRHRTTRQTYADLISSSPMSEERKAYWLA